MLTRSRRLLLLVSLGLSVLQRGECLQSVLQSAESRQPIVVNVSTYTQVQQLADGAHDLAHWSRDRVIVTISNRPEAAKQNLCKPTCTEPLLILEAGKSWPGNLFKIRAYRAAALALPPRTLVLFTDCCDVFFRPLPLGAANVFDEFLKVIEKDSTSHLAGAEVVIATERGYSMITNASCPNDKRVRYRVHDHSPSEFSANAMEAAAGVADECDQKSMQCLQSKLPNLGLVMGYAASLSKMYGETWEQCERCNKWESSHGSASLTNSSEQNEISHYLLKSKFNNGKIALDTDMALFHVTQGFRPADYSYSSGHIQVVLPGTNKIAALGAFVVHSSACVHAMPIMQKLQALLDPSQPLTYWSPQLTFMQVGRRRTAVEASHRNWRKHSHPVLEVDHSTPLDPTEQERRSLMKFAMLRQLPPLLIIICAMIILLPGVSETRSLRQFGELTAVTVVFLLSAGLLIFLNKNIMVQHHFPYACFIANMGILCTTVFSQSMVRVGLWQVRTKLVPGAFRKIVVFQSIFGSISMYAGNAVYLYLPVYLVQVLKSNTMFLVLIFTMLLSLERMSKTRFFSVVLICLGVAAASAKDFSGHLTSVKFMGTLSWGLLVNFTSNVTEAMRVTSMQWFLVNMSFKECLYHIYPWTLLVTSLITLVVEGRSICSASVSPALLAKLLISGVLGCMTTVSGWMLTRLIGALSVKVLGYARNFMIVVVATLCHGEVMSIMDSFGYTASLLGVFLYIYTSMEGSANKTNA